MQINANISSFVHFFAEILMHLGEADQAEIGHVTQERLIPMVESKKWVNIFLNLALSFIFL